MGADYTHVIKFQTTSEDFVERKREQAQERNQTARRRCRSWAVENVAGLAAHAARVAALVKMTIIEGARAPPASPPAPQRSDGIVCCVPSHPARASPLSPLQAS